MRPPPVCPYCGTTMARRRIERDATRKSCVIRCEHPACPRQPTYGPDWTWKRVAMYGMDAEASVPRDSAGGNHGREE